MRILEWKWFIDRDNPGIVKPLTGMEQKNAAASIDWNVVAQKGQLLNIKTYWPFRLGLYRGVG